MHKLPRQILFTLALPVLFLTGCAGSVLGLFNPEFLTLTGISGQAADIPGLAPAVLVQVENRTNRTIDALVSYRLGDDVESRTLNVEAGGSLGEVLICPVTEITLGDISNLDATGAVVRLGNGGDNDPIVQVEPFGVLLKEGINYDCGDAITFAVIESGQTLSGYQTVAFIQRSGNAR